MIKIAAWNIRGRNDPLKQKEVISFVKEHSLSVVCLLETRVRISNKDRIFTSILPGWSLLHNYDHALLGRIWVCWKPSVVSITAMLCTDQAILCRITVLKDNSSFFCSAIYASNIPNDRRVLWSHLQGCSAYVRSMPWFLLGDFNTTKFSSEKIGGNMNTNTAMEEFHDCLFDAGASINTPNIGNSALIIEELDLGGQDALNTCENSFVGPHLGLGRQKKRD